MFTDDTETGHAASSENLSTPPDDQQVELGAQPWVEEEEDEEHGFDE